MANAERTVTLKIAAEDAYSEVMNKAVQSFYLLGQEAVADLAKVNNAFTALNLKSNLNIDVEKAKLLSAFNQIKESGTASADEIKRAQIAYHNELDKLDSQLKVVRQSTVAAGDTHKQFGGTLFDLKGIVQGLVASLAAFSLADLIRQGVEAEVKMQALNVQFKTISGNSALAAQNLQYVRDESNRLGLVFTDTADAFAKFAASAKGTAVEGEGAKRVFTGVTEAVTALHLPADSAQRVFFQLSQMMSKNKVTAEDLNVVAESMPGTYAALAASMGLTTTELQQQMQAGKLMASDVLPKLGDQLHAAYGVAAVEGAKSAQAEFNRFKNSTMEVAAAFGQTLLPVLTLAMNVIGGVSDTVKGVIDILGPGAPVATGFAIAIGAITLAYQLLTPEIIASTAALLVNPIFLTAAAGAAAVLGVAAAIRAVAEAIGLTGTAAEKSAEAQAKDLKAKEEKAAKEKKILDDYEKAMGTSLDRQLEKEQQTYDESVKAVGAKYDQEIQEAGGNVDRVKQLEAAKNKDLEELYRGHLTKRQELRNKDSEGEVDFYRNSLKIGINYYKAIGDKTMQDVLAHKLSLAEKINVTEQYYNKEILNAGDNVLAVVALEQQKKLKILELKEQASSDYILIGLNNRKRELDIEEKHTNELIQEIKKRIAEHAISEEEGQAQILALEQQTAQKRSELSRDYAEQVRRQYGENSEEYKSALKTQEADYASYLGKAIDTTKNAEAQKAAALELAAEEQKNRLDRQLNDIQRMEQGGVVSKKEATKLRLQAELDYYDSMAKLAADNLSQFNPETQTKEYLKALKEKQAADRQYNDALNALQQARLSDDQKMQQQRLRMEEELHARKQKIEQEERKSFQAFATWFYGEWDRVTNSVISLSGKMAEAFGSVPKQAAGSLPDLQNKLADVEKQAKAARDAMMSWSAFDRVLGEHAAKATALKEEYYQQAIALQQIVDKFGHLKTVTNEEIAAAERAVRGMNLLDESDLSKVKDKLNQMKDALAAIEDQAKNTLKSLQDELDSLNNNKTAIESRAYQSRMEDLDKKLKEAQAANDDAAINNLRQAEQVATEIHNKKMQQLADEKQAAAEAAAAGNGESAPLRKSAGFSLGGMVTAFMHMAFGGKLPGGDSKFDSIPVLARPGEWFIRNEAADAWSMAFGPGFMAGINNPWSAVGQKIRATLSTGLSDDTRAAIAAPLQSIPTRLGFAGGGEVPNINVVTTSELGEKLDRLIDQLSNARPAVINFSFSIPRLDETTVRREVVPVLEKLAKLKA